MPGRSRDEAKRLTRNVTAAQAQPRKPWAEKTLENS